MKPFDKFVDESIFRDDVSRAPDSITITRASYDSIQREAWNNCLGHSIAAIRSVEQDWNERGMIQKGDGAAYIIRVLETGRIRSTDII